MEDAVSSGKREPARTPRISVLMTVYNGMPYLEAAVESILNQTFGDFEFVIVDDGSTDETGRFLANLSDERIVIVTRANGGTAAAANQGLSLCRGEFVARMDADDVARADRFQKQIDFAENNPSIGMVGSFTRSLGERRLGEVVALPVDHEAIVSALLDGRHALSHPSLLIRTTVLKSVGGYWPYRLIDDWDMMLRVSERTRVANIPEPLLHYRVHRGSLNGSGMARMRFSIDLARARAVARSSGASEPTPDEFADMRSQAPVRSRVATSLLERSLSHYRIAVAERNGPNPVRAIPHLVLAALARPDLVVRRIGRQRRS